MAATGETDPYSLVEPFSSLKIKFAFNANTAVREGESVPDWFDRNHYALIADLVGFKKEEIEEAVNEGGINAVPWPRKERKTDFLWAEDEKSTEELTAMANRAVDLCNARSTAGITGAGDVFSIAPGMGDQQLALAGLIYARELDLLREIPEIDTPIGPLYVVRGSEAEGFISRAYPEEPAPGQ